MRRSITERYLLSCDEIFVVCNIGRAVTDVGVETVFELARQADLANIGISENSLLAVFCAESESESIKKKDEISWPIYSRSPLYYSFVFPSFLAFFLP